ncbi:HNH endonuclease [Leclercia tamurae]|uniref:HNH endonuclease n=1 Tax=Leclercia tamurae TaxID=2926467 RepID=UPI0036F47686
MSRLPDAKIIFSLLDYERETGTFRWKCARGAVKAGDKAGNLRVDGYVHLTICGRCILAHRLVWLFETGSFPDGVIDHVNCIKSDNRFENLRLATVSQNNHNLPMRRNNSSGVKGVTWHKQHGKWHARCKYLGVSHHVGYFNELNDAEEAVKRLREKLHGEFCNHGGMTA